MMPLVAVAYMHTSKGHHLPHFTEKETKAQIIQEKQSENEHRNQIELSKNVQDFNITTTHTMNAHQNGKWVPLI